MPKTRVSYNRARYYDPVAGRFIAEDPIGFGGGINFYRYSANNPTISKDPFGLNNGPAIPWPWPILPGGSVGAAGRAIGRAIGRGAEAIGRAGGVAITAVLELTIFAPTAADDAAELEKLRKREPTCNSGRQTKCTLIGTDKELKGCIYACDDGTLWWQPGPCPAFIYRDWRTGVPNR